MVAGHGPRDSGRHSHRSHEPDPNHDQLRQEQPGHKRQDIHAKHDHGGETNLGVTKAAWAEYMGRPIADGEMKALTPDIVKPFYKIRYWDKCKCDSLPTGVDYMVFDLAVNGGVGRGAKMLQTVVGVNADGAIGPATLAALAALKDFLASVHPDDQVAIKTSVDEALDQHRHLSIDFRIRRPDGSA
jgi:hypothetical protein